MARHDSSSLIQVCWSPEIQQEPLCLACTCRADGDSTLLLLFVLLQRDEIEQAKIKKLKYF